MLFVNVLAKRCVREMVWKKALWNGLIKACEKRKWAKSGNLEDFVTKECRVVKGEVDQMRFF